MKRCTKCNTTEHITSHHLHPVTFYGGKKTGIKVCLCSQCHKKVEYIILSVESFVGNTPFGTRFKLEREAYERILRNFIRNRPIIYVEVSA